MPDPQSAVCPHCGQHAPIVLRGAQARCTVCGGWRLPFATKTLNLAGSAARFGGGAARFIGWGILAIGLTFAVALALLVQTLFPAGYAGLAVGLPIAVMSLFFGIALVIGGGKLRNQGVEKRRAAEFETIRALFAHRRGVVTAADAARALSVSEAEADARLTVMALNPDNDISLDLDDDGRVLYLLGGPEASPRWRIADPVAGNTPAERPHAEHQPTERQQAEREQAELEAELATNKARR